MRAVVLQTAQHIEVTDLPQPLPGPGEALVKLRAAALNRRDYWIQCGLYPGLTPRSPSDPTVLVRWCRWQQAVIKRGSGKRCVINPGHKWGKLERAQAADFEILGNPRDGTFADFIVIPEDRLHRAPIPPFG